MRAAEPVELPLASGMRERVAITVLHALSGLLLAVWAVAHGAWTDPPGWAFASAVALVAVMAGVGWLLGQVCLPRAPGRLRWDGQQWLLAQDACAGLPPARGAPGARSVPPREPAPLQRLVVAIDAGPWLLLRLHAAGRPVGWRVADAASAGPAWHRFRLALANHAGAASRPVPP